jgi:hypothetical protein
MNVCIAASISEQCSGLVLPCVALQVLASAAEMKAGWDILQLDID